MRLLRNSDPIDPEVQRQLDAIDDALAGEPVDARDAELAQLALAVRDQRPVADEVFAEALDEKVARGFAPWQEPLGDAAGGGAKPPKINWARLGGAWRPLAAGAAASALLVSAVATSGVFTGDKAEPAQQVAKPTVIVDQDDSTAGAASPAQRGGELAAGDTAQPADRIAPPPQHLGTDPVRPRRIERDATLVLATGPGDVEDVADEILRVTDAHRGFVLSSSVTGGEGTHGEATFQLRIPAERLQAAIADLSEVAHVRERRQDAQDITSEFVSVRSRTTAAQKERQSLLRQLAVADTPNEAASVKVRLRSIDRRLASLRSESRSLRNRVGYSNVDVTVRGDSSASDNGGFTPSDALHDAGKILSAALASALVALAVAIPAGIVLILIWLASARLRGRARERALDASQAEQAGSDKPGDSAR